MTTATKLDISKCPDCGGQNFVGNPARRCAHPNLLQPKRRTVQQGSRDEGAPSNALRMENHFGGLAPSSPSLSRLHVIPITPRELRRRAAHWIGWEKGPTGVPLESNPLALLKVLRFRLGQGAAVPIADLEPMLGLSAREIKQAARDLRVVHGIRVGSLRGHRQSAARAGVEPEREPYGYFLCLTEREVVITVIPRIRELRASAQVVDAMTGGRLGLTRLCAAADGYVQQHFNFKENAQ